MSAPAPEGPHPGPLAELQRLIQAGTLRPDPGQQQAAAVLQRVHDELARTPPRPLLAPARAPARASEGGGGGWLKRLLAPDPGPTVPAPAPARAATGGAAVRGAYLHGPVGRGKSMLMDLFCQHAPAPARRRVHFHAFMAEVHEAIHHHRQASQGGEASGLDALPTIARHHARQSPLLCLDEFHVTDVADAMILGRLLTQMFAQGMTIVATSNVAPVDLYRNGLQRDRFLPVIDLIAQHMDVVALTGPQDHRRVTVRGYPVYFCPLNGTSLREMEAAFAAATAGADLRGIRLSVSGRTRELPRATRGVAWLDYTEVVRGTWGANDYLALAAAVHTLFLANVPAIDADRRDEAKRLILLIDALYDQHRRLVMSAAAPPDRLYPAGHHAFEFGRAASRLIEMQSAAYLAAAERDIASAA